MPLTLVDTNVLVDVLGGDPSASAWSLAEYAALVAAGDAAINPVIYAELAGGFPSRAALDLAVPRADAVRLPLPFDAGWVAGRAHAAYRARGGTRQSPLADFWIGAHAEAAGLSILTRDVARYRTNFPSVPLICPPGS